MGIGLALVRRLVELHGGTISAASPGLGQGSEFVVCLPPWSRPAPAGVPTQSGASAVRAAAQNRRRILVVDDNVDAAESPRMILTMEGHEVQVAHDGAAALRVAEVFLPDAVLLDIGLPRIDGYEVARRLRERPDMKNALLVAVTGSGQPEDLQRSQRTGFDVHLVKPVPPEALRQLLDGPSDPAGGKSPVT
jgi:CheY-like chemotaxis protein